MARKSLYRIWLNWFDAGKKEAECRKWQKFWTWV